MANEGEKTTGKPNIGKDLKKVLGMSKDRICYSYFSLKNEQDKAFYLKLHLKSGMTKEVK